MRCAPCCQCENRDASRDAQRPPKRGVAAHLGAAVLLFACGLVSLDTSAWEIDVHYGLTKWLALQAGFAEREAETIARGDEGVDDSWITGPVHGTVVSGCVGEDPAGSSVMHDNHFPSRRDAPDSPDARIVQPGQPWREGSERSPPKIDGSPSTLLSLGRYLHSLQDSWSHQGVPDIPPLCRPQLAWGHALTRGGWSCHLADLTYRWQSTDVPATAEATYAVLREARHQKPRKLLDAQVAKVAAFASAKSKWEKDAWFKREGFADRTFLQSVSLPDCDSNAKACTPYPYQQFVERWTKLVASGKVPAAEVPKEVAAVLDQFFTALIAQGGAIVKQELVDRPLAERALARALHVEGSCPQLYDALSDFYLGGGFVTGRGAQQPLAVCELTADLRSNAGSTISCADAIAAAQKSIAKNEPRGPGLAQAAAMLKSSRPYVYTVARDRKSGIYFASANFVHLPRDILLVSVEKVRDRPKVTSAVWMPNE